jgi:Tfp pilus assembly protein PilF
MPLSDAQLAKAVKYMEAGDWQAAHEIVQRDEESPLACWAHGIVHLMEGDLPNARYWYRQAQRPFPAKPTAAVEIDALKMFSMDS